MDIAGKAKRVRIYISETDRHQGLPMYEALIGMLLKEGYAGATALRGMQGFGHSGRLHTTRLVDVSWSLPIVIDVVDRPEKVEALLLSLEEMGVNGLVTVEDVEAHPYGLHWAGEVPADLRVSQLMTREVMTVSSEALVSDAVRLLYGRLFRALPVVDGQGRVVGMLTNGDLVERAGLPFRIQVLERLGMPPETQGGSMLNRPVSEVMSSPVITIREDATAREAARIMIQRGVKRLPLVDDDGRPLGIISRLDLLGRAVHLHPIKDEPHMPAQGGSRVVDEVMIRDVPSVRDRTPLGDVLGQLLTSPIHRVVVTDAEESVVGIISDADVLESVSQYAHPGLLLALRARLPGGEAAAEHLRRANARAAADVMNRDVVCARSGMGLAEVAELMVRRRRKLLPVVDAEGRLMGVVGRDDVLAALVVVCGLTTLA